MSYSVCAENAQYDLEYERRMFELEKKSFKRRQEMENMRIQREKELIEMKLKILEEELRKLAKEKKQLEKQKELYNYTENWDEQGHRELSTERGRAIWDKKFFRGVGNELALKKRYKELIKIFHPDNMDGDTHTLQEINREYDQLKKAL
ncbi:molecular chaperone DnaJ [Lachnospiraceae bacterium ZAX-1]